MRLKLLSLSILIATLSAQAQTYVEETNWITGTSQFVSGAGSNPSALIDGDPSTVWTSAGSSFTVKLPGNGYLDNTPFRVRFTIPAGSNDYPTAFAIYGSHDNNGTLDGENALGYTTSQINFDGSVEYTSPVFYIRGGFNNQWWLCTHMRFECTETPSNILDSFQLADFQILETHEYEETTGPVLQNNGDIINAAENNQGNDWYNALIDDNPSTYWDANSKGDWVWQNNTQHGTGLIVEIPVSEDTEYKLRIGRTNTKETGFPTEMKWSYQPFKDGAWLEGGTINIDEVAPGESFTTTFNIKPEYYRIKFETTANVGDERIAEWAGKHHNTVLSCFQFYGPTRLYTPAPDPLPSLGTQYPNPNKVELNQEYFKEFIYSQSLAGFEFEHTHGIVDHDFDNNFHSDGGWITNTNIWDAEGHLSPGFNVPGADQGVELPDFSYDAPVNSSDIVPVGGNRKRQPTTTIVHDVYVIPGERVDLIPYTDMWNRSNYFEDFYRYYDYVTDKAHDDVYFLFNPRAGAYNEYGIFGGRALGYVFSDRNFGVFEWNENSAEQRGVGGVASFYRPADESDELINEYIAADFSQHYYVDGSLGNENRENDVKRYLDVDNKIIHEPIINFRHVFHIIDGRTLADEMSANRAANEKYINKNRRHISARANNDFSIRLTNAMPAEEGTKANFYYKKKDGSYTRMGRYDIETYEYTDGIQGKSIEGMFGPDERSSYNTPDIQLETEVNPGGVNTPQWITANQKFYRAIKCEANKATEGTFLIRFIAKDTDGNRILLEDGNPLILREIVVDFLGADLASFELEENIPPLHNEEYLESNYQAKSIVDFDKYMALSGTEFVEKEGAGERTKYPAPWMNSSYAFGYKYKQDYSTYMLVSHADCVPYAQATQTDADKHDRLWNRTGGKQQGFFYYANAAGDPGDMAHIPIPRLCVGSTIHISAWINSMGVYMNDDYNNNEPANVIFNLIAVTKDGREINVNSFSTGYVPNDPEHCGKWMHTYCQITPDLTKIDDGNFSHEDIDYYQVVLENNTMNSNGADYAIDDIRIYVAQPEVDAIQLKPLCNGEKSTTLRIDMAFKKLLNTLGKAPAAAEEEAEELTLYYTIYDKEKFEELSVDTDGNPLGFTKEIFDGSVLEYKYNDVVAKWGKLTFTTHYESLAEWDSALETNIPSRYEHDGEKCISFNITPCDENLEPGKQYIAFITIANFSDDPVWSDFDLTDICSKQAEFTVRSSNVIKVDGIVKTGSDDLAICENQFPVVQIDIYGIEAKTGNALIVEECPLIDWFKGRIEDLAEAEFEGIYLDEALLNFRYLYPEATSIDQEFISNSNFSYNEAYKKTISHFIDNGQLIFASYSYLFDAVRFEEGQKSVDCFVVALPANRQENRVIDNKTYTICNEPTEVKITVDRRAPGLLDGFDGVDYPDIVHDVPIRMGLKQLYKDMYIPLRNIYVVTPGVNQLIEMSDDTGIYLVKTNDPSMRNLEAEPGANSAGTGLRQIGLVKNIQASISDKDRGNALVNLENRELSFKEGYYYTLRLNYREKPEDGMLPEDVCDGQTIFTIKIVAEYQIWTGEVDGSMNFNNDDNWRRVTSDELLSTRDDEYTTTGSNENTYSYSPLDFTKIIIPAGEKYPYLFSPEQSDTYHIFDGKTELDITHPTRLSDNNEAGLATANIEYDLIAKDIEGVLFCRPWYANSCEQIHFLSNAEIINQQHLLYQKAWIDMEMEPARWYTASSPLKAVVAGDMYLPTDGARQESELFEAIDFSEAVNDRFRPAVYQRGWDRGVANVYELPSASSAEVSNVAIALDWSNVYNDVQESYSCGKGYSIKTDVTDIPGNKPDMVLFRLPKNDSFYEYWTQDRGVHGIENGGIIDRTDAYRLNPVDTIVTINNNTPGKYFLVGNPFMAHLDMKRFLEVNSNVIQGKFWIMTRNSQQCTILDPESDGFIGTVDDATATAPMQGFFVEANATVQSIALRFTPDMITWRKWSEDNGIILKSISRAESSPHNLTISARNKESFEDESQTLLCISPSASEKYTDNEDVLMLNDREAGTPGVYTIAGNKAVSINSTPKAEGVEIGLIAPEDAVTILRFDNTATVEGLSLLDTATGKTTPLTDGLEIEIEGCASGRLFITAKADTPEADLIGLKVYVHGSDIIATAPNIETGIDLAVYSISGQNIATVTGCMGEAVICNMSKGFYIVTATATDGSKCRLKVAVQ